MSHGVTPNVILRFGEFQLSQDIGCTCVHLSRQGSNHDLVDQSTNESSKDAVKGCMIKAKVVHREELTKLKIYGLVPLSAQEPKIPRVCHCNSHTYFS